MRAGFVGTGGFGRKHAEAAKKLGVTIAGCFNTNSAKAESFAKDFGATIYSDPREMISRRNIDVLYIVVPPGAHDGKAEDAAIRERIPFLAEKPVAIDLEFSKRIAKGVQQAGLVTAVGYLLRESPLLPEARAVVARNRISSVRACRMADLPEVHWWRKMAGSGGPMVSQWTHLADLMRYVFGDVKKVAAFASYGIGTARVPGCDIYDSMETILSFESGAIGNLGATNAMDFGFSKIELFDAYGQDCYLSYDAKRLTYKEGENAFVTRPQPENLDLVLEINRKFLAAVEKNDPTAVLSDYADGVKSLALALAMTEAAATGKIISPGA